ncbi:MAG: CRISP-associated protein Cas1 [Desulfobacteraceae bacterium Eth-SRB2]|nr:MAG: CRISP-associated protein Cas1 [Desulfobacteraceae bacterium Eth-SRB2]
MESLYVIEPGCYLRREGASIKVFKDKKAIQRIPADGLKKLLLAGYVSLTGGVMDFLIKNRVETVFITPTGRFRARLAIDEHRHVELRRAQYLNLADGVFAARTAGCIVAGKIDNMTRFILIRARQYKNDPLRKLAARLKTFQPIYKKDADGLDRIRGLEGAATRIYYSAFNDLIKNPEFKFHGRNRRPPLDPVNALLSFVYTLLTNEVLSAIKANGLDPYMGALHEISYGRPSLACDLVEEYRSFLGDRLVLGIINRKMITPDDFVYRKSPPKNFIDEQEMRKKRPVEMKPAIMKALIATYEEMMNRKIYYPPDDKKIGYRWLIHRQVAAFGNYLKNPKKPYKPFKWES